MLLTRPFRSLTNFSDRLTDEKVLFVLAWWKCERNHNRLIHVRWSFHLDWFGCFPNDANALDFYRSNAGNVIGAGTEIIEESDTILVRDRRSDSIIVSHLLFHRFHRGLEPVCLCFEKTDPEFW